MRAFAFVKTGLAALALGALAACATPFKADVSRFQQMPAAQGQTFTVVAAHDTDRGGLEFAHYAALVSEEMTRQGYRPAADGQQADMTVRLSYGVDSGRERVVRDYDYDPFWGPGYGFYGRPVLVPTRHGYRYAYGFYDPFLFGPGFGNWPRETSYTVYTSGIDLMIENRATGQRLFEGSAEARSTTNDLTKLVPNLIEAMFTGFPGNSGEKVRITVAPPERQSQR